MGCEDCNVSIYHNHLLFNLIQNHQHIQPTQRNVRVGCIKTMKIDTRRRNCTCWYECVLEPRMGSGKYTFYKRETNKLFLVDSRFLCNGCRIFTNQEINGTKITQGHGTTWFCFMVLWKKIGIHFFPDKNCCFCVRDGRSITPYPSTSCLYIY